MIAIGCSPCEPVDDVRQLPSWVWELDGMSADLAVLRIHSEAIRLLVARLFHSRVTSGPLSLDKRTFPFLGSLLAGVLHPFRPRDYFWFDLESR